jgi:hypothetical protein
MDVQKESVMLAVFAAGAREPKVVKRLPNEKRRLRRFLNQVAREEEMRACYE